jgi:hypothetical protein
MNHAADVIKSFRANGARHLDDKMRAPVAGSLNAVLANGQVLPASLYRLSGGILGMVDQNEHTLLFTVAEAAKIPVWMTAFHGELYERQGFRVLMAETSPANAAVLRRLVSYTRPQPLGLMPSFGFGDRIGLATSGHAAAVAEAGGKILPVFAQQSIREMSRTKRTAEEVMDDATWGVFRSGWTRPFGADADHLKTESDVDITARAGFVFFTIDPSDFVDQQADNYDRVEIESKFRSITGDNVEGIRDVLKCYREKTYEFEADPEGFQVVFDDLSLKRAAVKYGRALGHTYKLARHIAKVMGHRPFEIELSVDETPQPTSVLEHLFIALELERHGVSVVSIAPRFVGSFEKGVDYKGDISLFERSLTQHAAIAERCGPYKLGVHSGSDKFGIYPSIGRICNGRFHVKTAGTSYLEALRVVCRADKTFFRSIIGLARKRFETDRATYHLSTELDLVPGAKELKDGDLEKIYLDQDHGRQILHVTFGSVLTQGVEGSALFRTGIRSILNQHRQLHEKVLRKHLGKHLTLLQTF